jgi:hypothetical protein
MQKRTRHQAALHGHPGYWTTDDCEAARRQANETARPWGLHGPTPEEAWSRRRPISEELRRRFLDRYHFIEQQERINRGILPGVEPGRADRAAIDRVAIPRALAACGILEIRRRRFTLPISP